MNVAIIGAGISGLSAASVLQSAGHQVALFDKGRGVGGRMATRRAPTQARFDHGAQYFTARNAQFEQQVQQWIAEGVAAEWTGRIVKYESVDRIVPAKQATRYVGSPGMNAIAKHMANGLNISTGTRVAKPRWEAEAWHLQSDEGEELGQFDWLLVTAPPVQARELLAATTLAVKIAAEMQGCWAAMLEFADRVPLDYDAAFCDEAFSGGDQSSAILSWIARNNSKPGREPKECWVVHGSPGWSEANIDRDPDEVLPQLVTAMSALADGELPQIEYATAHRWRYAIPIEPLDARYKLSTEQRVAICGDWCGGPRVEGAWLSGQAAAEAIIEAAAANSV